MSYVRRMDPSNGDHVDQRLESVPWEHLLRAPSDSRRRVLMVLVAVAAAVIAASAARTLWPAPPLTAVPISAEENSVVSVPTTEIEVPTTDPVVTAAPMSEADLRAVSAEDASRSAIAYAELFVAQWLTLDGQPSEALEAMIPSGVSASAVDPSARSFVESAIGLSATEVGFSTWQVDVVVRSLSAFGDGDYVRVAPRAFAVTVRITDDGMAITDLPSPTPIPVAQISSVETLSDIAPTTVMERARAILAHGGLVDESSLSAAKARDCWRVEGIVRDAAGVPVKVAVWLDGEGRQVAVPAGG